MARILISYKWHATFLEQNQHASITITKLNPIYRHGFLRLAFLVYDFLFSTKNLQRTISYVNGSERISIWIFWKDAKNKTYVKAVDFEGINQNDQRENLMLKIDSDAVCINKTFKFFTALIAREGDMCRISVWVDDVLVYRKTSSFQHVQFC